TDGSLSQGARAVTVANFDENSPNDRCCDRSWIRQKAAASQNAVVPPLPRATTYPFGRPKSSVSPLRIRRTTSRTGDWLCDVPSSVAAARAATCSARTFVGPLPNRPSAGLRLPGMTMLVTSQPYCGGATPLHPFSLRGDDPPALFSPRGDDPPAPPDHGGLRAPHGPLRWGQRQ